jgi:hypothetical protein
MRATRQIRSLTGSLDDGDRRTVAARAILGEWLGGSGGGWQDSGGLWPSAKVICGVEAGQDDPEYHVSRGCLLPRHHVFTRDEVTPQTLESLQKSLVLVHGGMAQDVGPILEMVTEKYLLRSDAEWEARLQAMQIFDELVASLRSGSVDRIGPATNGNFFGPIQTIIPWATNFYTESIVEEVRREFGSAFQGFWMLGGMAGGGMGFIFDPDSRERAQVRLQSIMRSVKQTLEASVPFAIDPVVYDFAINERGSWAEFLPAASALMPAGYYVNAVPGLVRTDPALVPSARRAEIARFAHASRTAPEMAGSLESIIDRLLPPAAVNGGNQAAILNELLDLHGFDSALHDQIQSDLRSGRIGLRQNRLPASTIIEDIDAGDVFDATAEMPTTFESIGKQALESGEVAVVTLAGGAGTRWTHGSGVIKALNPFWKTAGRHRSFLEVHLAKSRRSMRRFQVSVPHVITTSYLTHSGIQNYLNAVGNYGYEGDVRLSSGRAIGLRMIPMVRDLQFAWEEVAQQTLDERQQKVRESVRAALMNWARSMGEGSDYRDNVPAQCIHPVGHWYELPNMLRNGVLLSILNASPQLRYLMLHNVDTLGVDLDPAILGGHIQSGAALSVEVIARQFDDRGGGLARINGRARLVEGLALPSEEVESRLSWYNSSTTWVDIDQLLRAFELDRAALGDGERVSEAVRNLAGRIPTYVTIKDVKKRWGKGQEDVYPVCQWEKLWGDMTALPGLETRFIGVSRFRGQQLKDVAQLDGWSRDGSAAFVESLCDWQ